MNYCHIYNWDTVSYLLWSGSTHIHKNHFQIFATINWRYLCTQVHDINSSGKSFWVPTTFLSTFFNCSVRVFEHSIEYINLFTVFALLQEKVFWFLRGESLPLPLFLLHPCIKKQLQTIIYIDMLILSAFITHNIHNSTMSFLQIELNNSKTITIMINSNFNIKIKVTSWQLSKVLNFT